MAGVNPGRFIHAFRYEKATKAANTSGGQNENYNEYINARGEWERLSGERGFDNGLDKMISVYQVTTFWRSALEGFVNKDTKLIYDNRVFRIDNIERIGESRQYYQFTVSEAH